MIKRIKIKGKRYYYDTKLDNPYLAPSVTTVLSLVKDPKLEEWKEKVGKKKAKKISKWKANRGNVLHRMNEEYLINQELKDAQDFIYSEECEQYTKKEISVGKNLFYKLYRLGWLDEIDEMIGSELRMITSLGGGYAGTADVIGRIKDKKLLIDFKSATNPKESIPKYILQASGYWMMYAKEYDLVLDGAEIWIITENLNPQRWIFTKDELKQAGKTFLKYVKRYHQIYESDIKEFKNSSPIFNPQITGSN